MAPKKSQKPDNLKDLYDLRNLIERKYDEEEKINDELNFIESLKYHISNRDNLNEIEVSILNELIDFTEHCNHSSGLNFIKANQSNLTRIINKYNYIIDIIKKNPTFNLKSIYSTLKNKQKTANNYIWKYEI